LTPPQVKFPDPPLELCYLHQPGLVDVEQPSALRFGMLQLAIQALELGREQLVIRGWDSRGDGSFAGQ
jgi:hypothetical protein